jgi:serine/threonine-protein kinase
VDDVVGIVRDMADALDFAHAQGIVHRDIKPENILLAMDHAVVADFGIARAMGSAGEAAGLTATGVSIGTPHYMSPEQGSGDLVDRRTDIYALGCVTFEMLAGEPPFTGHSAQMIIARHVSERPPSLCAVRPTLPGGVDLVVHRALAKVPADRFASAGEFATALSAAVSARPGAGDVSRSSSGAAGSDLFAVRHPGSRRRVTAYALVALLVIAAVARIGNIAGSGTEPQSGPTAVPAAGVRGRVSDDRGNPLADVQITVDGVDVRVYTTTAGEFLADLPRVQPGDVIVLRAAGRGYQPFSEVRRIGAESERFDIVLRSRP